MWRALHHDAALSETFYPKQLIQNVTDSSNAFTKTKVCDVILSGS